MNETPDKEAQDDGRGDDAFEALLLEAMRVDVPVPGAAPAAVRRRPRMRVYAIAASLVLSVGVVIGLLRTPTGNDELPNAVIAHVHGEPHALLDGRVEAAPFEFEGVLRQAGARLEGFQARVNYVRLCPFRGNMVAHFVVEGRAGPVTVLLLPDEPVSSPMSFDEDGYMGTIAPLATGGSIAVVGMPEEPIGEIAEQVARSLSWTL